MDAWTAKTVEAADTHKRAFASQKADLASYQATLAKAKAGAGVNRGLFEQQAKKMGLNTSGRGKLAAIKHYEAESLIIAKNAAYKRTGILRNSTATDVAILKKSYTKMMADTKGTTTWINRQWQTMGLRFKVVTTGMKAMWAGTMSFMKSTAATVGRFMNKAFTILMVFSTLVMLWDMIKPYLDKYFGTNFATELDQDLVDAADNMRKLNKELETMANRFREKVGGAGSLADAISKARFAGNMANSADIENNYDMLNNMKKSGFINSDKGQEFEADFIKSIGFLAIVEPKLRDYYYTLEEGNDLTKKQEKGLMDVVKQMRSGKAAADQLKNAQTELNRAMNDYVKGAAKLKYGSIIQQFRLGREGATEVYQNASARMKTLETSKSSQYMTPGTDDYKEYQTLKGGMFYDKNAIDKMTGGKGATVYKPGSVEILKGEADKMGEGYDQYLGYAQRGVGLDISKKMLATQAVAITRTDSLADKTKKLIKIRQKGVEILQQELAIEVSRDLYAKADNAEDRDAAELAIMQQTANLDLLKQQKQAAEDLINPLTMIKDASIAAFDQGLQSAIMGVIDGTKSMKEGFLDMAKAVLQAIAQMIAKLIAMKAIQAMGFSFADGGVMPMASGGIKPKGYRSGGIVTEPTYLAGEGKYNEAIVPLPDGRSIPVMMKGGSGGNANVTVNIAADGSTTESMTSDGGAQGAQLGRAISTAVQEEMHKQQRPGGILSPYGG